MLSWLNQQTFGSGYVAVNNILPLKVILQIILSKLFCNIFQISVMAISVEYP